MVNVATRVSNIECFTCLKSIRFVIQGDYFPIQNFEKIFVNKSSVVISPVISPR